MRLAQSISEKRNQGDEIIRVRRARERGQTRTSWLDTRHTFSFGDCHDPQHMGFRELRVVNEDRGASLMTLGSSLEAFGRESTGAIIGRGVTTNFVRNCLAALWCAIAWTGHGQPARQKSGAPIEVRGSVAFEIPTRVRLSPVCATENAKKVNRIACL
jgi:hypothetical protein